MEKKGTMAVHKLELPSPDVRRWNLKLSCQGYNYDEKLNWTDKQRYFCNKLSQLKIDQK